MVDSFTIHFANAVPTAPGMTSAPLKQSVALRNPINRSRNKIRLHSPKPHSAHFKRWSTLEFRKLDKLFFGLIQIVVGS